MTRIEFGRSSSALPYLRKAVGINPDNFQAWLSLATSCTNLGLISEALQAHRNMARLRPSSPTTHSNLAYMLHYDEHCSQRKLFAHHLRFARKFAKPLYKSIQPDTTTRTGPLRIGYVSTSFSSHPVSRFLEPLLSHHNKREFQIFLYSATPKEDATTERIKQLGHAWRDIRKLTDEQAADLIRQDQIDILFDLMGYLGGHRLLLFARKPAPVQITYLGYPDTTALKTMDYKLTDSLHDPPSSWHDPSARGFEPNSRFYTEKLLYLDRCAWCYRPDPNSPPINALPALKTGHITFCSFNRLIKASPQIRSLWSRILHAVPNSKLKLLIESPHDQPAIFSLFEQSNIPKDRLLLIPRSARLDYLAQYNSCDIALDSFPYNGHTTTCDALWMGVPVVSLAGQTHCSRAGLSVLSSVGLAELAATTPQAYVQTAINLAHDLPRLSSLRSALRQRMQASPLRDETTFTKKVEELCRSIAPRKPAPIQIAHPAPRSFAPFTGTLPYFPDGKPADYKPPQVPSDPMPPKTILFAWELGGGLGHLMQILPLAQDLAKAGHTVYAAMRNIDRAGAVLGQAGVRFLPVPCSALAPSPCMTSTFSQLLLNVGFSCDTALFARACAWRNLFSLVKPDLVLFDHAPTALLASRGLPMRRALIGSGFCSPPDAPAEELWGILIPQAASKDAPALLDAQQKLLSRLNRILSQWKQPPLHRLCQLYSEVDQNFLTTFPELDHFPSRRHAAYFGQVLSEGGEQPLWPAGKGKRIFAYLKPKGLEPVLKELSRRGNPTLLYCDGAPKGIDQKLGPCIYRSLRPLDMTKAAAQCDLAILNAGHGATAQVLLAGKPILQLPLHLEQRLVSQATRAMGASVTASPSSVSECLDRLLDGECDRAAGEFARKYGGFDEDGQRAGMIEYAGAMLCGGALPLAA